MPTVMHFEKDHTEVSHLVQLPKYNYLICEVWDSRKDDCECLAYCMLSWSKPVLTYVSWVDSDNIDYIVTSFIDIPSLK